MTLLSTLFVQIFLLSLTLCMLLFGASYRDAKRGYCKHSPKTGNSGSFYVALKINTNEFLFRIFPFLIHRNE